jgi:hypothetical protein
MSWREDNRHVSNGDQVNRVAALAMKRGKSVDFTGYAGTPMTAREIADALIADKTPQATPKQAIDLQAAILAALRKRNGGTVRGERAPTRWRLLGS